MCEDPNIIKVDIYNSLGQEVFKSQSLINDISSFKPGLYFIRIENRNNIEVSKIIKK